MNLDLLKLMLRPLKKRFQALRYRSLVQQSGLPLYDLPPGGKHSLEIAFADIFRQLQSRCPWLDHTIYPVGGAASHSFVCILVRTLEECGIKTVIEFGAGQSSKILSKWALTTGGKVFTVEQDAYWADHCRNELAHPNYHVIHAPMCKLPSGLEWYDEAEIKRQLGGVKADLIIVDGPIGTPRWSRAGIIECFAALCQPEWAVLWDDLERFGDYESFAKFIQVMSNPGPAPGVAFCQAFRTLGMAFTDKYIRLKYFC